MTTAPWVTRINISKTVSVTPVITASSYTSGFQLGGVMTLTDVIRQDSQAGGQGVSLGFAELVEVTVLDKAAQSVAIDIFLFNTSPTLVSSDHAAFNITDANLVASCIGVVSVGTAYSASSSNSVSSTANLNKPVQASSGTNIYAVAVVRGAPTYVSTSDLQFQFSFFID